MYIYIYIYCIYLYTYMHVCVCVCVQVQPVQNRTCLALSKLNRTHPLNQSKLKHGLTSSKLNLTPCTLNLTHQQVKPEQTRAYLTSRCVSLSPPFFVHVFPVWARASS